MRFSPQLTDEAVLKELGGRLAGARIERNLTQAALAEQAGVSKRTVERLESGEVATRLSGFLRVCRAFGFLERFEMLLPEPVPGPMAQLKQAGRKRQRATGKKITAPGGSKKWTWGEPA
jgi:transcriptional regulator with XRE-family HTH domain